MKRLFTRLLGLFTSYGTACVILLLMCLLTYLGTIEQVHLGLYEAQKRYFESWFVVYPLPLGDSGLNLKIPLPGVILLLVLFSINLILGGLLRLRRKPSNFGLFIVHGGILFLLLGGLIDHAVGYDGQMTLAQGQTGYRFQSYHDWELAIIDPSHADHDAEYVIPQKTLLGLAADRTFTYRAAELPFELVLNAYQRNAQVLPKGPMFEAPTPVVNGFFVNPLRPAKEAEQNLPAVYLTLVDKQTGQQRREILWGRSPAPLTVEFAGRRFDLLLRHTTWNLPFGIKLNKFIHEYYPGTQTPKHFQSDVTKIEQGRTRDVLIRMNEPLRTEGYVFFQASFLDDPDRGILTSTLAVAKNPADQWPLYACVIITFGMLVHFGMSLARYLRRERVQPACSSA